MVQFLENRALRLAGKSSEPIGTLFWALEQLDQTPRAFAVLEEALQRRQDDAELQLLTAEAYGRHGRFADAERLLAAAEPRSRSNYWLRKAAEISMYRGDRPAALEYWKKVLAKEPQAADAHQAVSQLLAEVEGHSAALEHLSEAAAAHETNFHIQSLYIHWLKGMDPFAAERITQQFVERRPNNAWAWRELAVLHARLGRIDEALSEAERAKSGTRQSRCLQHHRLRACRRGESRSSPGSVSASYPHLRG